MHVAYQVIADGVDVTGNVQDRLVSLAITDEAGQKSDMAEITLDDRDHAIALPPRGAKLQIALGFTGDLVQMGTFVVDEISGQMAPGTLTISAKAADMLGSIRARKTRNWSDVTLEEIVSTIAGEHGLEPAISDTLKAVSYGYLAQTAESDLNVLTRLAKDLDAIAKPASGYLVVTKRGEGKAADGTTLPVLTVHQTQVKGGSWSISGRRRYGSAAAEWVEKSTAQIHTVTAGDSPPELTLRHRYASEAEALRAAAAALDRAQRSSGQISIELGGFRGDITAEAKVDLQGIKPDLTGEWLITRVQHQLRDSLTTSFDAERDTEGDVT